MKDNLGYMNIRSVCSIASKRDFEVSRKDNIKEHFEVFRH